MKTDLELALECAINIYHQYAVKHPIDDYLSKDEFSELLKKNAKPFLHNTNQVRAKCGPILLSLVRARRSGGLLGPWGLSRASQRGRRDFLGFF
uniref:S100/CaBP-9k-type calcium binding subdomain domain-containing protein n=1 Tax=Calidris pygmaea TaxID=425635 RepID=A0A8C3JJ56_9CHAR